MFIARFFYVFFICQVAKCTTIEVSRTSSFETWSRTSASHGIKLIANLGFFNTSFQIRILLISSKFFEVKSRIMIKMLSDQNFHFRRAEPLISTQKRLMILVVMMVSPMIRG